MRYRLRVDPTRCDGSGLCAELLPERVKLDDWGYPMIDRNQFGDKVLSMARRAVRECPRLALRLDAEEDQR